MGLDTNEMKKLVAREAVDRYVKDGMNVGLGTGSTAKFMIERIGELVKEGYNLTCAATSVQSEELAKSLGINVVDIDEVEHLDITIDGADEVSPDMQLIKGLGGALLREKIVAAATVKEIIITDESKLVEKLGTKAPLPVEVLRFGHEHTKHALEMQGCKAELRMRDGEPFIPGYYCFGIELPAENESRDSLTYYLARGRYAAYSDFERAGLSLFTPEYWETLKVDRYRNYNGRLAVAAVDSGSVLGYSPTEDRYELIAATDERIEFAYITKVYMDLPIGENTPYQLSRSVIAMEKTADGWRFSSMRTGDWQSGVETFDVHPMSGEGAAALTKQLVQSVMTEDWLTAQNHFTPEDAQKFALTIHAAAQNDPDYPLRNIGWEENGDWVCDIHTLNSLSREFFGVDLPSEELYFRVPDGVGLPYSMFDCEILDVREDAEETAVYVHLKNSTAFPYAATDYGVYAFVYALETMGEPRLTVRQVDSEAAAQLGLAVFFTAVEADEPIMDWITVTPLAGSLDNGAYSRFSLTADGIAREFTGTMIASRAPEIYRADFTGDGADDAAVIFLTAGGTGVQMEEIHVFDGDSWEEIPCVEPIPYLDENAQVGSDASDYWVVIGRGEARVDKRALSTPEERRYEKPGYGQRLSYEVRDNTLFCRIPLWISPTETCGDFLVSYRADSGQLIPVSVSFEPVVYMP